MSNGAIKKIVCDVKAFGATDDPDVKELALVGAILTASGDYSEDQQHAHTELDEWLLDEIAALNEKRAQVCADYVTKAKEIMG